MTLTNKLFIGLFIGFTTFCSAQMETYNYKRALNEVTNEWHQLIIPEAVFGSLKSDFSDLRIYGVTKNDTIEAPYYLKVLSERITHRSSSFDIINKTKGDKGYYFTFQLHSEVVINQISLDFNEHNFDWKVELQGSQNQQEWFTILEDYRIMSIKNKSTNFKFTKLEFPNSKFRFYRLIVKHDEQPQLNSAQLSKYETTEGTSINYSIKKLETIDDKEQKATIVNLELKQPVALSQLNIDVSNTFDYYRPVKIEYRRDSVKIEKGWKYDYKTVASGTLNSLEANLFKLPNTIAKHLRVTIYNDNNQPLSIAGVSVKGYEFQMIGRFTEPADYMLVYGNPSARQPVYDINRFETKVPKDLKTLTIGAEELIVKPKQEKVKPLFENSYWLWGIIGVVMLLLGGFTLRMLKKS